MGDADKRAKLNHLAQQHKDTSSQLQDILKKAMADAAFKKRLLEDPDATVKSVFSDADSSMIRFISTLDSSQFEAAMKRKAEQSDAEAGEAEAEAEAEA